MTFKFRRAIIILAVFVGLAVIHLFINTQNIDLKYKVTDLKLKTRAIKDKNRQLKLKISKNENLAAIEQCATKKLKMLYPKKINYVTNSGHSSTEARP